MTSLNLSQICQAYKDFLQNVDPDGFVCNELQAQHGLSEEQAYDLAAELASAITVNPKMVYTDAVEGIEFEPREIHFLTYAAFGPDDPTRGVAALCGAGACSITGGSMMATNVAEFVGQITCGACLHLVQEALRKLSIVSDNT